MRILHIEKFYQGVGGVGTYLRLIMQLQRRQGHEVFRFGCVGRDGPAQMPRFHDFAASRRPADLLRMIHNKEAAEKLQALLRRRSFDVAHLHNIYHHLTPSILPVLARHRLGIVMRAADYRLACPAKHFLRSDGLCTRCLANKFYHAASSRCAGVGGAALAIESIIQRFFRRYFRWVDLVVCPTHFMHDVMVRAGLPASKAVIVPNLISPIALPHGVQQRDNEILYAGRISPEKSPQLILDLAERLSGTKVTVLGDGPGMDRFRRDVATRRLKNVDVLGHVDHSEIGQYFARAAVVILTSRCMENSPMSMLEAMHAERCVVVPDHEPLREWIRDGQTGRTFRTGQADSLAAVVQELLGDPPGRRRLAREGRKLVRRRHDQERIIHKIERLYAEAIRRCALRW